MRSLDRRGCVRTNRERVSRTEPFEVFTRPQRSAPARIAGLLIRLRAELFVGLVVLYLWTWLAQLMPDRLVGVLVVVIIGVAVVYPPSRRYVVRRGLAVMTRHRLRAVFVERRIMNYSGNVPLLLWSRPTPVGERVWLLLRAGIDLHDIERNLTFIAVACWASDARATVPSSIAALVVV